MLSLQDLPSGILFDHIAPLLPCTDMKHFHHVCMTNNTLQYYKKDSLLSWIRLNPDCTCLFSAIEKQSKLLFFLYLQCNPRLILVRDCNIIPHAFRALIHPHAHFDQLVSIISLMLDAFRAQKEEDYAKKKIIQSISAIYHDIATSHITQNDYDPGHLMFLLLRFFNAKDPDPSDFLLDANAQNGMLWMSMVRAKEIDHLYYMKTMQQTLDEEVRRKICDEISSGVMEQSHAMHMMYWLIDMIPVPSQEEQDDHAAMTAYVDKVYDIIVKCSRTNIDEMGFIDIEEGSTITIAPLFSLEQYQNTAQFIMISIMDQQNTQIDLFL